MTINQRKPPRSKPVVDFTWSPTANAIGYTVGGDTYPYSRQADNIARASDSRYAANYTPILQAITFTANAKAAAGAFISQYRWDFGDGTIGYGASVAHTYVAAEDDPTSQVWHGTKEVTLFVTDNFNQTSAASHTLNLVFTNTAIIKLAIQG